MAKIIYSIFIGILLTFFVMTGIRAFYPEPQWPDYPQTLQYPKEGEQSAIEEEKIWQAYDKEIEEFEKNTLQPYYRNISMTLLIFAVALLAIGVFLAEKLHTITDGLLFGGVFLLLWGAGQGLAIHDKVVQFVMISISLAVALVLGYWKFEEKITRKEIKKKLVGNKKEIGE